MCGLVRPDSPSWRECVVVLTACSRFLLGDRREVEAKLLAEIGRQTARVAITDMVENKNYFSICTVEAAVKACDKLLPRDIYDVLRPLHCVDWKAMDRDLRAKVQALCYFVIEE